MKNKFRLLTALVACLTVGSVEASSEKIDIVCADGEAILQCASIALKYTKISQDQPAIRAFNAGLLLEELQDQVTGSDAGSAVTGTEDFLPNFIANLPDVVDGIALEGEEETDEAFDISWNLPFCPGTNADKCIKVSASLARNPKVYEPLLESVNEAQRSEADSAWGDDLDSSDDYAFSLAFNYSGKIGGLRFGRDPAQYLPSVRAVHRQEFFKNVKNRSDVNRFADYVVEHSKEYPNLDSLEEVVSGKGPGPAGTKTKTDFNNLSAKEQQHIEELLFQFVGHAVMTSAEAAEAAEASTLQRFTKAIDNQPQLIFSASSRTRDSRVGADEQAASIRLEIPLEVSVNTMLASVSRECLDPDVEIDVDSNDVCMRELNNGLKESGQNRWRAVMEYQYLNADSLSFLSDEFGVNFSEDGSESNIFSANIARKLGPLTKSDEGSEVTFELSYQDVSNDPLRNNRSKAALSWAFKWGPASIPLSIVYANKPELDLEDTDEQITATLGIKYDLNFAPQDSSAQ